MLERHRLRARRLVPRAELQRGRDVMTPGPRRWRRRRARRPVAAARARGSARGRWRRRPARRRWRQRGVRRRGRRRRRVGALPAPPRPPVDARGLLLVQDVHRRRGLGERVAGAFRRDVLRPLGALLRAAQRRRERDVSSAPLIQRLGVARLAGRDGVGQRLAVACVEIKILRRVRPESPRRPPRHRRDACSMAWRCRFLVARPSQRGHVVAAK